MNDDSLVPFEAVRKARSRQSVHETWHRQEPLEREGSFGFDWDGAQAWFRHRL